MGCIEAMYHATQGGRTLSCHSRPNVMQNKAGDAAHAMDRVAALLHWCLWCLWCTASWFNLHGTDMWQALARRSHSRMPLFGTLIRPQASPKA